MTLEEKKELINSSIKFITSRLSSLKHENVKLSKILTYKEEEKSAFENYLKLQGILYAYASFLNRFNNQGSFHGRLFKKLVVMYELDLVNKTELEVLDLIRENFHEDIFQARTDVNRADITEVTFESSQIEYRRITRSDIKDRSDWKVYIGTTYTHIRQVK